jgi:hypothetical protein
VIGFPDDRCWYIEPASRVQNVTYTTPNPASICGRPITHVFTGPTYPPPVRMVVMRACPRHARAMGRRYGDLYARFTLADFNAAIPKAW